MNAFDWILLFLLGASLGTAVLPRDGQPLTALLTWIAIGLFTMADAGCCDQPPDCTDDRPAPRALPVKLRAVGPDGWADQLTQTVADIEFGIGAVSTACRAPHFEVVDAGADLDLELALHTPCAVEAITAGEYSEDRLVVVGRVADIPDHWRISPMRGQVAHELGHLIGLGHADPGRGESAMTVPPAEQMYARDVAAIACQLGCGPCDPMADRYDR